MIIVVVNLAICMGYLIHREQFYVWLLLYRIRLVRILTTRYADGGRDSHNRRMVYLNCCTIHQKLTCGERVTVYTLRDYQIFAL